MSYPVPILRIEVEGVKHSIVQHLATSAQEFAEIVREEVEQFDIEANIRHQVKMAVPRILQETIDKMVDEIGRETAQWVRQEFTPVIQEAYTKAYKSQ